MRPLTLLSFLASSLAFVSPLLAAPRVPRLDPRAAMLRGRQLPSLRGDRVPLVVRFDHAPGAAEIAALEGAGAEVLRRSGGAPSGARGTLHAMADRRALGAIAALPHVRKVTVDAPTIRPPAPVDLTIAQVGAPDAWITKDPGGLPLRGAGITICDIDSSVNPFHPQFMRADGGYFAWTDVDGDGLLTPGTDTVDVDGQTATLRVLNSVVTELFSGDVLFGSDDPTFQAGRDYLYADLDGSGEREYGAGAGFDDAVPALGEPLFLADDVDGDGALDLGEKLVRLSTPKVKHLVGEDGEFYNLGDDLSTFVPTTEAFHGSGACGVLVGGNAGLTEWVGMAPDADLVVASNRSGFGETYLADYCVDKGAKVVLHEYAPWTGYPLDGSTELETFIDDSFTAADPIVHVNPAGNLAGAQKLMKRSFNGALTETIEIPGGLGAGYFYGTFIWRDTSRDLSFTITSPTGQGITVSTQQVADVVDGITFFAFREDSSRGTARVDFYHFADQGQVGKPKVGTWTVDVTDPSGAGPVELIGYVADEVSGWGQGIRFIEGVSEDHLIGHPGTADDGIPVAAYAGNAWVFGTPGDQAYYSGRGYRIDGEEILWITGPDDPVSAGYIGGQNDYVTFGGTSGASPHVAGAAALLFQADPSRTAASVKQALKDGALVDGFVGAVPNHDWGWGKLRVHEALFGTPPDGGTAPSLAPIDVLVAVGQTTSVPIDATDAEDDVATLSFAADYEYDGRSRPRSPARRSTSRPRRWASPG